MIGQYYCCSVKPSYMIVLSLKEDNTFSSQ